MRRSGTQSDARLPRLAMIDVHCHLLPGLDDGARDLPTALEMARAAVADGVIAIACTPHINPGKWNNSPAEIHLAFESMKLELKAHDIPLHIFMGADLQVQTGMAKGLITGALPTINDSRYFLLEPPQHMPSQRLGDLVIETLRAGYVPIIAHPERLAYIENEYEVFAECAEAGAWIQLAAGSLLGQFGRKPRMLGERFLKDGITHLLATEVPNIKDRRPVLGRARRQVTRFVGEEEATRLVFDRPRLVLEDGNPNALPLPPGLDKIVRARRTRQSKSWVTRFFA